MIEGRALPEPPTERPDCPECAAARVERVHGLFDARCLGCIARHLAESPAAWRAVRGEGADELLELIAATWRERADEGRRAVWAWIKTLRALRAPT